MAASVKESTSVKFRKQGNERFEAAKAEGINKKLMKDRLMESVSLYQKAYNSANNNDERASAAKNIATTSFKLAPLQAEIGERRSVVQYFYKEAITYYSRALIHGDDSKPQEWVNGVYESLQNCIEMCSDSNNDLSYRQRIGPIEECIGCMTDNTLKAQCYIRIANDLFKEAITQLNSNGYKTALHDLRECHRPIEEAKRLASLEMDETSENILSETRVLEADCFLHLCIAESIQARHIGDELLEKATKEEESVNISMILDIIDWYKKAIIQTRENDVEQEAIALSRLGYVYDKILKKQYKAQENYHRCVQLALSMHPRTFNSDAWYIEPTAVLKRYQDEKVKQEDIEWNKKREQFVKEAETELSNIKKEFNKGDAVFIQYIYKEFPPKKADHKLGDMKTKSLKSLFKTALVHYHPDKQKTHGEKWVVICEEICKLLTQRYECYKGED